MCAWVSLRVIFLALVGKGPVSARLIILNARHDVHLEEDTGQSHG